MASSLYSRLPETSETRFAREMMEIQSEVTPTHTRTHTQTHKPVLTMNM